MGNFVDIKVSLMEIRHLKLIKAIVEEGNMTKAIDKLHLTQSALSYQLKEAEYQLGTKIFNRTGKQMVLTKAGEKVYDLACDILLKIMETEQEIKAAVFGEIGEIRISSECFSGYHWLPAVLKQFQNQYPNIELKIVMEGTHFPLRKLLADELDIAVVSDTLKNDKIKYIELFQDEMVMVVSSSHKWTDKKFITAEDFLQEHLIIHSFPLETVTIHQQFLGPAGISPKRITALPLTEASIEMVKADMGVMSMARWAFMPYAKSPRLKTVKIGRKGLKRSHFIAVLNNKTYPEYFNRFIEFLQAEINQQWAIV